MSDTSRPASLPRLTVRLDRLTDQAVRVEAAARMQSRADLVRDAVRNELRVRRVAAVAAAVERARIAAETGRIARAIGNLSGRPVTIRPMTETECQALARRTAQEDSSE